jgi:hypothetical protein
MGVTDRAEEENVVPLPIHSESSVSRSGRVDRSPSLRKRHNPYVRRPKMRPAAMRPSTSWHVHRESKTHWGGMLMTGAVLDLRRSTRVATRFVGCFDCDTDSDEDLSDNEAYRACCAQIAGEASGGSGESSSGGGL